MKLVHIVVSVAIILIAVILQACGQNINNIPVVNSSAPTIQLKCGVSQNANVTNEQAFCIAKLAGLKSGIRHWGIHVYPDYIDIYNTTSDGPSSRDRGMSVRIARIGGEVVNIQSWEEIVVD